MIDYYYVNDSYNNYDLDKDNSNLIEINDIKAKNNYIEKSIHITSDQNNNNLNNNKYLKKDQTNEKTKKNKYSNVLYTSDKIEDDDSDINKINAKESIINTKSNLNYYILGKLIEPCLMINNFID